MDFDALAGQQLMCGLSDNPGQFREPPMWRLLQQCQRARQGDDGGMSYMTVPFESRAWDVGGESARLQSGQLSATLAILPSRETGEFILRHGRHSALRRVGAGQYYLKDADYLGKWRG